MSAASTTGRGAVAGPARIHRAPAWVAEAPEPEWHDNVRLHGIAGVDVAVVWLSGQPWCAIATNPNGGHMLVFAEDQP